jgi:hypothetical protein
MAEHLEFTVDSGVQVYSCDPHSPWQRGSNENINGLLRQYLGKSHDLRKLSQADLDLVADEMNGRPPEDPWMENSGSDPGAGARNEPFTRLFKTTVACRPRAQGRGTPQYRPSPKPDVEDSPGGVTSIP